MSTFRSEEMRLVQLFIQSDAAHDTLVELGNVGAIQFKDLNPSKSAFQRTFVNNVRQCDEMERILRFVHAQLKDSGVKLRSGIVDQSPAYTMDELATRLEEIEQEISQNITFNESLSRQLAEVIELQTVLQRCGKFFNRSGRAVSDEGLVTDADGTLTRHLSFIAGLIPSEKLEFFGRTLFRSTRGNMILRSEHLDGKIRDPKSGELIAKAVFIVFFSGDRSQQKISRICDTFGATRHPFPERSAEQSAMMVQVESRVLDLTSVLDSTKAQRDTILSRIAGSIDGWFDQVRRNKAIFHTMNLFNYDVAHKCLIAEGWCPSHDLDRVRNALSKAQEISGAQVPTIINVVPTKETPPTFFRSNKFTRGFQEIIDAYGIARYQEYNPAVFSVITFPFLFGVMFGDAGHGLIMTLVAAYMCLNEKKLSQQKLGEMPNTLFQGRYVVLLMGMFAFYCGCLYNEVFSIMNQVGESQWKDPEHGTQKQLVDGVVYPFGVDPGWSHTGNKLNYYNSLKMKMSILFGVTQMVAGVFCKLANSIYFKDRLTLWFVFVPEVIFINSIFGYLCLTIFIKWSTNYDLMFVLNNSEVVKIAEAVAGVPAVYSMGDITVTEGNANLIPSLKDVLKYNATTCAETGACSLWKQNPPSLLDMLIKMFMSPGNVPAAQQLFAGQSGVQVFLLLIAFASVPVLLVARPLILKRQHGGGSYQTMEEDGEEEEKIEGGAGGHGGHGDGEHFDFGEIMIHQIIHTIEYVLGCISNTASYLRLWALSLAHAQLSEVFWERLVVGALESPSPSPAAVFVAVTMWATLTFGVLMLMESLSAFLHALRLHWVEFMTKFYGGDGTKYIPLDFEKLPKGAEIGAEGGDEE